jgi:hypothetical protein
VTRPRSRTTRRVVAAATALLLLVAPSAAAVPDGAEPRAERIALDPETVPLVSTSADGATSEVLMRPTSVAPPAATAAEQRSMRLAAYQPTGRFVRAGDEVTLTPPAGYGGRLEPEVHVLGDGYDDVPAATQVGIGVVPEGGSSFVAQHDGFLYLADYSSAEPYVATVTGGEPMPVWVLGHTTRAEFEQQRAQWPGVAVQLVTPRTWLDMQTRWFDQYVDDAYDLEARVQNLDDVARWVQETYGLSTTSTGVHRSHGEMVHVVNSNGGAGAAYATHYFVNLHGTYGSQMLLGNGVEDQWGLWHEIGHVYQHPDLTPSWGVEVTVNIPALTISRYAFGWNRLDGNNVDLYHDWFAKPVAERDFHAMAYGDPNHFVRLRLYDQLLSTFGPTFYPRLMMEARVHRASGGATPVSDVEKMDHFAALASRVSGTDLREFFRQWGVPLSPGTQAQMAASPTTLATPVWEVLSDADVVETVPLAPAAAPDAVLTATHGSVLQGQTDLDPDQVTLTPVGTGVAGPIALERATVTAGGVGAGAASVTAVVRGGATGVRNVFTTTTDVIAPGDGIHLRTSQGWTGADILLDPAARRLRTLLGSDDAPDGAATITLYGHETRSVDVAAAGDLTMAALRPVLGGAAYDDGDLVRVTATTATSALTHSGGALGVGTHWLQIQGDQLVPVPAPAFAPEESGLQAPTGTAVADGVAAHRVSAVVRDHGGDPVSGVEVTFTVTAPGQPGTATVRTGADGRAALDVTSVQAGESTVSASVAGQELPGSGAVVRFVAGPAAGAASGWRLDPVEPVPAGTPAVARVEVRDAQGNPVEGAEVAVAVPAEVTVLEPGPHRTDAAGLVHLTLSAERAGEHVVTVTVGGEPVPGPAVLAVVPGPVDLDASTIEAPAELVADGSGARVAITLRDAYGNLVTAEHAVAITTTLGSVGAVAADGPGGYAAVLSAQEAGTAHLGFTVDGVPAPGGATVVLHAPVVTTPVTPDPATPGPVAADPVPADPAFGASATGGTADPVTASPGLAVTGATVGPPLAVAALLLLGGGLLVAFRRCAA